MTHIRSDEMERCIAECEECRDVCVRAIAYCLDRRGSYAEAFHITKLLDCIDMCTACVNLLLRDSPAHRYTCEACAEICEICAESCAAFPDDEAMRACADACMRCAAACRDMVRMAVRM
jgi:hypothetical protein